MKPRVIILGGCGFIGRNLVEYLITNDLVETVRVVDKVPPQIAWLNCKHEACFEDPRVHFKSANLINPDACKAAFAYDATGLPFDYVINCAAETKLGQTDPVYKEGILKLSILCAGEALLHNVKRFIELSSGQMASNEKMKHKEEGKVEPWTHVAKWKAQVEESLATVPGLNYTILRPAIVYGPGDRTGLTPRLVIASVYKHLGESMKLLWTRELKMNTVHVLDVCRAVWHVLSRDDTRRQTYNVVDLAESTQGSICELASNIFNINHDYCGSAISHIAKTDLGQVVSDVNDKHMGPWAEACFADDVTNTPLSPYLDKELLDNKHLNLEGSKLRNTGFTYTVPYITMDHLHEVLTDYASMNLFPQSLLVS